MTVAFKLLCIGSALSLAVQSETNYNYWCSGNCNNPATNASPYPGLILMGGGTDVDSAFKQQITWSDCGDFLVIRSDRDNKYNDYIMGLGCANSAATIQIKNRDGANDEFVLDKVNNAHALFFAGGNQDEYLSDWVGTKLQSAIQQSIDERNVPIGGTSAGCDIQSWYIYNASEGSVTSPEALANPYNSMVTLTFRFIVQKYQILNNSIVDTHFVTRERFGRLTTFVARLWQDYNAQGVRGIGINEQSAIVIDLNSGVGTMMGPQRYSSMAYIITPSSGPQVCKSRTPLTYHDLAVQKLMAYPGDQYDFVNWKSLGADSAQYFINYDDGVPDQNPY